MARIEIDPNYSSPTFSRATAATDLFKKEDVQALAAAMSTHDHSAGKGLILPAGAIPDGSITSAKIADGTIVAADIAGGTITYAQLAGGAAASVGGFISGGGGASGATSPGVLNAAFSQSVNLLGGLPVLVLMSYTWYNNTAGQTNYMDLLVDNVSWYTIAAPTWPTGTQYKTTMAVQLFGVAGGSPGFGTGTHTFNPGWHCSGGGMQLAGSPWMSMLIVEFRR